MSACTHVSAILFLCLFAGQAGLIAFSPVLTEVVAAAAALSTRPSFLT